ncbi:hypothetical protein ATZ33_08655 [Enterococcus silesiacus]|uniref:Uncharacterized protein n=1 Tax=Enterococcus silesiacus TaxID=332949 RepID=A0ABM5W889_9ENTE|nr:hypothetical protein ATZ33_08655 [Enterococcus silesiacus]
MIITVFIDSELIKMVFLLFDIKVSYTYNQQHYWSDKYESSFKTIKKCFSGNTLLSQKKNQT